MSGRRLVDLLFPPECAMCEIGLLDRQELPLLCESCLDVFRPRAVRACSKCAAPLPESPATENCLYCRKRNYRFARATCLGIYRDVLRDAVLKMKRQRHETLTLVAGTMLAADVSSRWPNTRFSFLVPMPIFWSRRLARGTNTSEVLAESMARVLRIERKMGVLRCTRKTEKQGTLLPTARFSNVKGAFKVSAGYDINGADILLVDDIMTTGATADAAARALLRAGAATVSVAVVARGIGGEMGVVPRPRSARRGPGSQR